MAGNIAIFVPHAGCPNMCSFCNQKVISGSPEPPDGSTVAKLCRNALAELSPQAGQVEIAFFGGSFTAIERPYMLELLQAAEPFLAHPQVKGIRVSTRPDAIDTERLELLRRFGVTAVELGAQSMDDAVLALNRRGHTAADVERASERIRSFGFSLGLQMMTGLYGATRCSDEQTGLRLAALNPDTMRIYPTVVLEGTPLAQLMREGSYTPPDTEQSLPLCAWLAELFERSGIRVIRIGLHASPEVERDMVGGCYHPALGELVMGERYYNRLCERADALGGGNLVLRIQPRLFSQVVGQHRRNIERLGQRGCRIRCVADSGLESAAFTLEKERDS